MLDKDSFLTREARAELKKFKYEYLAKKLGVSRRRAEGIVNGRVRVLAIEKSILEDLLEEVPA